MRFLFKIIEYGLYLFIFLLPWQTRLIWRSQEIGNQFWEYGSFSLYGTEILLWCLTVLTLFYLLLAYLKKRKKGSQPALPFKKQGGRNFNYLPFLIFIVYVFSSALWSENRYLSLYFAGHILEVFVLGWLIVICAKLNDEQWPPQSKAAIDKTITAEIYPHKSAKISFGILLSLSLAGVIQAGLALWQFLTQSVVGSKWLGIAAQLPTAPGAAVVETELRRYLRAYGSLPHPNILAGFLVITLAATVILYVLTYQRLVNAQFNQEKFLNRDNFGRFKSPLISKLAKLANSSYVLLLFSIALLSVYALELAAIILTFSRSAWLASATGVILTLIVGWRKFRSTKTKPALFKMAFITAIVLISLGIILKDPLNARGQALFIRDSKKIERLESKSNQERLEGLRESWSLIKINPFLGWGAGNYTLVIHQYFDAGRPVWRLQPAHNIYLLILSELGIVGLLLFFWLIKELLSKTKFRRNLVLPFAVLSVFLIIGLFDHYLWSLYFGLMLWGLIGGVARVGKSHPHLP